MARDSVGSVTRVKPNVWKIRWDERSENGRKQRSRTIHGSRRDAERALNVELTKSSGKVHGHTLGEYWEAVCVPEMADLATKTREEYLRLWEREIAPYMHWREVADIDHRTVQQWVDMVDSPTVQRHAFALLRKTMNMAIRDGLTLANPCTRYVKFDSHRKKRKGMVAASQMRAFLEMARGSAQEPLVLLCLGGGLRPEEAYALEWEDVQPFGDCAVVDVNKARVTVKGGDEIKPTKTESSTRRVVIGAPFAARLLELKSDDAVCPCKPCTAANNWRKWQQRREVEPVTFKDMRSNYATLCGEAGCQDSLVSLMMGHTDGTTRGRNYQGATVDGLARVARELSAHLAKSDTNGHEP